jgi:hypothetical protein
MFRTALSEPAGAKSRETDRHLPFECWLTRRVNERVIVVSRATDWTAEVHEILGRDGFSATSAAMVRLTNRYTRTAVRCRPIDRAPVVLCPQPSIAATVGRKSQIPASAWMATSVPETTATAAGRREACREHAPAHALVSLAEMRRRPDSLNARANPVARSSRRVASGDFQDGSRAHPARTDSSLYVAPDSWAATEFTTPDRSATSPRAEIAQPK